LNVSLLRWIAVGYLYISKRFSIEHAERLPTTGPVIVVCNHVKAFDPVCLQVASRLRLIRFMQAREYYQLWPVHRLLRMLQVIPVNRTGNDTASVRTALRVLADGGCLGIFPEGKISEDGALHEAHKGVGLLALASKATVIPAYVHSSHPHGGMLQDFLQFNQVRLSFGEPVRLEDLRGRHREETAREAATQRIMDAIIAVRDSSKAVAGVAVPAPTAGADDV
jgi:1-acyl-sn-glycerol-3-phosphate acyltransferase